ncbi:LPXTG cell wall anchor domain-containing protein [Microbacterium sp. kSW2-24]|uniref:alpha/beta hydrolase-fold protein n=1 Tax=Microbacterium galbinum TaxID=2851646 RepID=UPI001FFD1F94|nr:alpha/beta hydrolase-fold protein [Microbacterium galbinum]MCK2024156.1 LPXTG cell wall anchor domain-containing protein [Microbacterium galbinum]
MRFDLRRLLGIPTAIALTAGATLALAAATDTPASSSPPITYTAAASAESPDDFIRDVQTWTTTSAAGRDYKISVALPANYDENGDPHRVLYVTDANAEFGMAVETARLNAPGTMVVGIGYDDPGQGFAASGVRRTLDLTPTEITADVPTGGAPEFLDFLRSELVPQIESEFRADPADRALMGHSFGGLFATYALLHNDGLFHRFVIASPSIWWDDRTILDMEADYAETHDALDARVFLSVGELEETTSGFPMTSDMTSFAHTLAARAYDGLELGATIFDDETHLSVIGAAFSRGLRFIYAAPGTDIPGTSLPEQQDVAPQIVTQPSDAEIPEGATATFTATATGTPEPTVIWQTQLPDAGDWVTIPDAAAPTLSIDAVPASASGTRYRAVFTNAVGESATEPATLTVTVAPEVPASPSADDLTDDNRGPVTAPATVAQGAPFDLSLGTDLAGATVDVYLFSDPTHLGTLAASSAGIVQAIVPTDAALGAHRVAVYATDGALIGWVPVEIVAAPSGGATAPGDRLADTGADAGTIAPIALAASAAVLLGGGAALLARRRRSGIDPTP